jgi:hypothetical protein
VMSMRRVINSAGRGVVAAMAMTGTRQLTTSLGLVDQTPPDAVMRQKAGGLIARVPADKQQAVTELAHWTMGAVAGAAYATMPKSVRRQDWSGIAWGLIVLSGFELIAAPALGLSQAKHPRPVERLAFIADHLLFGLVLDPPRHEHL